MSDKMREARKILDGEVYDASNATVSETEREAVMKKLREPPSRPVTAGAKPMAYYIEHAMYGVELSLDPTDEASERRGWTATPLYAAPPAAAGREDEDHPDCTTDRERELYDALMGLASHATANYPNYRKWSQGGLVLAPVVARALRLEGSELTPQDGRTARAVTTLDRETLARKIWDADGPKHTGWPSQGYRVSYAHRDQYPADWNRCLHIADAILEVKDGTYVK